MAHSYVDFKGRWILMNDLDLIPFARFLVAVGKEQATSLPPRLQEMLASWELALEKYIPGAITLRIEPFVLDEVDHHHLLRLVEGTDSRIASFGSSVPASVINAIVADPLIIYDDQPVPSLREVVKKFRELVAPLP